jgi:hypothetical protein
MKFWGDSNPYFPPVIIQAVVAVIMLPPQATFLNYTPPVREVM